MAHYNSPGATASHPGLEYLSTASPLAQTVASPGLVDFGDLLAEFTAHPNGQSHLLSEQLGGQSPQVSSGSSARSGAAYVEGERYGSNERSSRSPEELLQDHYGISPRGEGVEGYEFSLTSHPGRPSPEASGPAQANQLAQAIASMDSSTQSQLLAALLSQQPAGAGPPDQHQLLQQPLPLPTFPPQQQELKRQSYPSGTRSHPQSRSSSAHPSPQSYHLYNPGPAPLPSLHLPPGQYKPRHGDNSQPSSHVSSPLASPFTGMPHHATQFFPQSPVSLLQIQQQQQAHLQQSPYNSPLVASASQSYQNAFSAASQKDGRSADLQAQQAMEVLERVSNGGIGSNRSTPGASDSTVVGMDLGAAMGDMRGGSATGGSYATTTDDTEWTENNDFIFSPLMSPALTPHSAFSSLPPSGSCLPARSHSLSLVSPSEIFSPLGSPAIMPHHFRSDGPNPGGVSWALQGLVDQTKAMGFDASPNGYLVNSPTLLPHDAGLATATGSGRRGAGGGKKSRPSPLLKPTPDGALVRRKKSVPGSTEKKPGSMGSGGGRSTTTSPFLGPTFMGMTSTTTSRTSPTDEGSINTPSPVDLAMNLEQIPSIPGQQSQYQQASLPYSSLPPDYHPEFMGPPPPPSSHSRKTSLTPSTHHVDGHSDWLNPVTPASFMNFVGGEMVGSDLSVDQRGYYPDPMADLGQYALPLPSPSAASSSTLYTPPLSASSGSTATTIKPRPPKKLSAKSSLETLAGAAGAKGKGRATPAAAGKKGAKANKLKTLGTNGQTDAFGGANEDQFDTRVVPAADNRRTSHKAAEQKRRDSLKLCFEELRKILPPLLAQNVIDEDRRPGEGNVGGQRDGSVDPENPNKGVSKVALLRRSNEYVGILHERIDRRNGAINLLRDLVYSLKERLGELGDNQGGDELAGIDLDRIDKDEKEAGSMAYYECLDSDEESSAAVPFSKKKGPTTAQPRRKSINAISQDADFAPTVASGRAGKPPVARRSTRRATLTSAEEGGEFGMDVEEDL